MKIRDLKFNQKTFLQKTLNQQERGLNDRNLKDSYFSTAVVYEYISNPVEYLNKEVTKSQLSDTFGITQEEKLKVKDALIQSQAVADPELLDFMPQNSILGYSLSRRANKTSLEIFYPFFPGHLSFPAKSGEHVWIFYEVISGRKIGYWMCRKPTHRQVDDINYTRLDRIAEVYKADRSFRGSDGAKPIENTEILVRNGGLSPNLPEGLSYEQMLASSFSYIDDFVPEPVLNVSKKCGDFQIQGSNNASITLGTEKFLDLDPLNEQNLTVGFQNDTDLQDLRSTLDASGNKDLVYQRQSDKKFHNLRLAGSIDLAVGRGIGTASGIDSGNLYKSINDAIKGSTSEPSNGGNPTLGVIKNFIGDEEETDLKNLENFEIDKTRYLRGETEGDVASLIDNKRTLDCAARIYASAVSSPDVLWEKFSFISSFPEGSIAVNYADHVRLYGNKSIKLVTSEGQGSGIGMQINNSSVQLRSAGAGMSMAGSISLVSSGGARITLSSNGDIELVPGSGGRIKLGPNPQHAIVTNTALDPSSTGGSIQGIPIVSTMGGIVGDSVEPHGGFSPYVLVSGWDPEGFDPATIIAASQDFLTSEV